MKTSWTKTWLDFKSPLRVVVQVLLRSRVNKGKRCQELKQKLDEAHQILARQEKKIQRQRQEGSDLKQQLRRLEREKGVLAETPIVLPSDPPVNGHGYGARTIGLAVELAKAAGLRGAERVMKIMFDWLGVEQRVPRWTTIRNWLQRLGVASMKQPPQVAEDWIWMADHSNQIGPEKALTVLAVRASQLPPPGEALKHEHVRTLLVQPGTQWNREKMAEVYTELADKHGAPRAIVCDGAVELRDGADCLKNVRSDTIVLSDFKHKAANYFKALLGKDPQFTAFTAQLGRTRSAIQQTKLAHLTPPSQKPKARFMNMHSTLRWANMAAWLLDHPQACPEQWGVTAQRLEDKLGWLREYADDLAVWRECQEVINRGLKFINEQGLFDGASRQLHAELFVELQHAAGRRLAKQLLHFVGQAERRLKKGERLWMSTEIVESSFALYKQLERQHSKGGFTSLLAGFGALMKTTTPALVKQAFAGVSHKDVQQWVVDNLPDTVTSKRLAAFHMFEAATTRATQSVAIA